MVQNSASIQIMISYSIWGFMIIMHFQVLIFQITSYKDFFIRGFTSFSSDDWFLAAKQSMETAVSNGGRIKFYLDDLTLSVKEFLSNPSI